MRQDSHLSFWTIALYTKEEEATYRHNIRISRDNNIMQIDLSGGINKISMFIWAMFGVFRFGTALIR